MAERPAPLPADNPDAQGIERRASTRYPCNLATSCRLAASVKDPGHPVKVRNISAGGISLVLGHEFLSGDIITIELRSMTRNFVCQLNVRVIYCIEHPSGDYILGGSFTSPLTDDEVKAFLA